MARKVSQGLALRKPESALEWAVAVLLGLTLINIVHFYMGLAAIADVRGDGRTVIERADNCPNSCSDIGICADGECFCPWGYSDVDCSSRVKAIQLVGTGDGAARGKAQLGDHVGVPDATDGDRPDMGDNTDDDDEDEGDEDTTRTSGAKAAERSAADKAAAHKRVRERTGKLANVVKQTHERHRTPTGTRTTAEDEDEQEQEQEEEEDGGDERVRVKKGGKAKKPKEGGGKKKGGKAKKPKEGGKKKAAEKTGERAVLTHHQNGQFVPVPPKNTNYVRPKVRPKVPWYNTRPLTEAYETDAGGEGYALTICALPKAFERSDMVDTAQENAMFTWASLRPAPHIVLYGDDAGVGEVAEQFGFEYRPNVRKNKFGTPTLDSVMGDCATRAETPYVMFINSDIALVPSEFGHTFRKVADYFEVEREEPVWMMLGRRRNMDWDLNEPKVDYNDPDKWEQDLRDVAMDTKLFTQFGQDFFLFPKHYWESIPPFAIGRCGYDNWIVQYSQRTMGASLVDVSTTVLAVHQNHNYDHIKTAKNPLTGPECDYNHKLAKGGWSDGSTDHAQFFTEECGGSVCVHKRLWIGMKRWEEAEEKGMA